MNVEEEGNSGGEGIDGQTRLQTGLHVGDGVAQGECQLLDGRRPRLADVIAAHRDRIPLRQVPAAVADQVGDQPHGSLGGIDVGSPGDVLLQNVILNRARQMLRRDLPAPRQGDQQGQQHRGGGVDRHRDRDPVERDSPEELLHVAQTVDSHAGSAHLSGRHGRIGVHAHLGGQIEGYRKSGLAQSQQVLVAGVGLPGRPEAGVLPHGPQTVPVHAGPDSPGEGIVSGIPQVPPVVEVFEVAGTEEGIQTDSGGCLEFAV